MTKLEAMAMADLIRTLYQAVDEIAEIPPTSSARILSADAKVKKAIEIARAIDESSENKTFYSR